MALNVKVGTFSASTSSGDQSVNVGFQPKVVLFFLTGRTSAGKTSDEMLLSHGWMHANGSLAIAAAGKWSGSVWFVQGDERTASCIHVADASVIPTETERYANPASTRFTSDSFVINWNTTGSAVQINYVALGGDDITNVASGTFTQPRGPGYTTAISGLGFQPDTAIIAASHYPTGSFPDATNATWPTWGIASKDGAAIQNAAIAAIFSQDHTEYGHMRTPGTTNPRCMINDASENYWSARVTSLDSGGFTLTFDNYDNSADYKMHYLAVKGLTSKLGSITDPTSTGNQATTGTGFQPQGLLLLGIGQAAGETHSTSPSQFNVGAGTSSSARFSTSVGEYASGQANHYEAHSASAIYTAYKATEAVACQADLVSLDSNGFTLNWTTIDSATAHAVIYWAFKGTEAGVTRAPGSGTVQITGASPTRLVANLRYPAAGLLQLVGATPVRLVGVRSQPGVGLVQLVGGLPLRVEASLRRPGVGAVQIVGATPLRRLAHLRYPDAGLVQLAGRLPTRVEASRRYPASGTLQIVGLAPKRLEALLATPGTAILLLAGRTPTALSGYVFAPSVGVLRALGIAPGVYEAHLRLPQAALLRVLGAVPVLAVEGEPPVVVTKARIIIAPVGFAA